MFVFFYSGGGGCWVGTFVVLRVVTHYKICGIKTFEFFKHVYELHTTRISVIMQNTVRKQVLESGLKEYT